MEKMIFRHPGGRKLGSIMKWLWIPAFAGMTIGMVSLAHAEPVEQFRKGNTAYADGKFVEAVTSYEAARKEGLRQWMLEYNLGNAYYRTAQNGKAVAAYWRAFRLNPGEKDVIDNLNLAATKAGDPVLPSAGLSSFFWRAFFWLSMNTLAASASVFFITLIVLGSARLYTAIRIPYEVFLISTLCLLFSGGWLAARSWTHSRPVGIVVAAVAEVRSGPNLSYPANFTVPEGRRVVILKEQEPIAGWLEIGVPAEGLKGWVPDSAVDVL